MALLLQNVPPVAQRHLNDCWIASFRMIEQWYNKILPARRPIIRKKLESLVGGPNMLNSAQIPAFATMAGMTEQRANPTPGNLEKLVRTYGPLWYPASTGAHKTSTQGHVVVIIGTDGTDVFFYDPFPPKSGTPMQQFPIADFFGQYLPPVATPSPFLVMLKDSHPGQ